MRAVTLMRFFGVFQVTAVSDGGTSLPSNNATIQAKEVLNVTDLKVNQVGKTWAEIQWKKSADKNVTYTIKPVMSVQNYPYLPVGNTRDNVFNCNYHNYYYFFLFVH